MLEKESKKRKLNPQNPTVWYIYIFFIRYLSCLNDKVNILKYTRRLPLDY